MENKNFVLPNTEQTVNTIISGISKFFVVFANVFNGIYFAYTIVRFFMWKNFLLLNIILCTVSAIIFVYTLLESFLKITFPKNLNFILQIFKRIVCFAITVVVFAGLFETSTNLLPYKILFCVGCLLGWLITVCGDIFNATIPKWADEIFESFKQDIEMEGLMDRSLSQVKKAVLDQENVGKKVVKGSVFLGGTFALRMLRKLIHR